MAFVNVEVVVDLSDFSTEDLEDELDTRGDRTEEGNVPPLGGEQSHPVHEIYYAFKFGLNERALELCREYVCNELGVVL